MDLSLYDLQGRQVRRIAHGPHPAGSFRASFDAHDLGSGVYFALLRVDGEARGTLKLTVTR